MRRILVHIFRIMVAAISENEPYGKDYQADKYKPSCHPRSHLLESQRVADLSLYVMRLECRGVHRHCLYLKFLRVKDKCVHYTVLAQSLQSQRREIVYTFVKGCYGYSALEVKQLRPVLALLPDLDGIHGPLLHDPDIGHQSVLELREPKPCTLLNLREFHTIEHLVGNEHGVPFLQRLEI